MQGVKVYGPVPSRRFGLSLGIDLIPFKTCCYDCVYCQVGRTTVHTMERKRFVDPDPVIRQVEQALREKPSIDVLTLSGSGEPTLYLALEELVAGLRAITQKPIALLTNSGLLWDEDVARAASLFDIVAPSLDAADPEIFARINRPVAGLSFEKMWDGLRRFCQAYHGICRLEIMLVKGLNDGDVSLGALAKCVRQLNVSNVDLNTVVRPPAYQSEALDTEAMQRAAAHFPTELTEIIARFRPEERCDASPISAKQIEQELLAVLARRPCTLEDLSQALKIPLPRLQAVVQLLEREGKIQERVQGQTKYWAYSLK